MSVFPSPIDTAGRYLLANNDLQKHIDRMEAAASLEAEMLSYEGLFLGAKEFVLGAILHLQVTRHPELIPKTLRGELCTNEEIAHIVAKIPLPNDGFATELFE